MTEHTYALKTARTDGGIYGMREFVWMLERSAEQETKCTRAVVTSGLSNGIPSYISERRVSRW